MRTAARVGTSASARVSAARAPDATPPTGRNHRSPLLAVWLLSVALVLVALRLWGPVLAAPFVPAALDRLAATFGVRIEVAAFTLDFAAPNGFAQWSAGLRIRLGKI